jgi:DNA-binding transcriptional LysR family regulator
LPAKVAAQVAGLGCGFLPAHFVADHVRAGRLVVKAVAEIRPPQRAHLAWRVERPGKALAWWLDAVPRSGLGQLLAEGTPAPAASTSAASPPPARPGRARRG